VVAQRRAEEEKRIESSRQGKSRTKVDLPSEHEGKDDASFPGGIVPKGLPNKRMGGKVRTRRR
jgi:hypothetical protein